MWKVRRGAGSGGGGNSEVGGMGMRGFFGLRR